MAQVRVREKHQVTLPASIVREANISQNDVLDISYRNGVIALVAHNAGQKKRAIRDYVGIMGDAYGATAAEVNEHISSERDTWER